MAGVAHTSQTIHTDKMSFGIRPTIYTRIADEQQELSDLKKRVDYTIEGIARLKQEDVCRYTLLADEQQELRELKKRVAYKIAEIYRLKQEATRDKTGGENSVVLYLITLEDECYRYNLRGDMFDEYSDKYVGHWNGTKLDRSATPPETPAIFPSFFKCTEFTG